MKELVIFGAGGHTKVIIDMLEKINKEANAKVACEKELDLIGLLVDNLEENFITGYPVIGNTDFAEHLLEKKKDIYFLYGMGNNYTRMKLDARFRGVAQYLTVIHPTAAIATTAIIKEGTVIMANASVNAGSIVKRHCIINTGAVVEHDCILEDFVHISPNATLCGSVTIGKGSHVGAGAVVLPEIRVGEYCIIGAGAVVTKNVSDNSTVMGIPATKKVEA